MRISVFSFLLLVAVHSLSARDLQHRTCRLRCCLLEVGHQPFSGLCCESSSGTSVLIFALVEPAIFCAIWIDPFLKLSDITSTRSSQGVRIRLASHFFCVIHTFSDLAFDARINIPSSVPFSHPSPKRTHSTCLSHNIPASGWTIQISIKRNHRAFDVLPRCWPLVSWKTNPNIWTF